MKKRVSLFYLAFTLAALLSAIGAEAQDFHGEWADKKFLSGKAVFQLSLEQNKTDVLVFFSAAYNNGSGAAPEADGKGKITPKGMVEFKWKDSFQNSGTGTISREGADVVLSIKPVKMADSRCAVFYGDSLRLKPAGVKKVH